MELFVGTYEGFLLGHNISTGPVINNDKVSLSTYFTEDSHCSTLRCMAVHDNWLATGGSDDRIFIYDMKEQKQKQILLCHDATINVLRFTPDGSYLLSGSSDGRMVATSVANWSTAASWDRAHNQAAITHITCHPSGKMALSLAEDMILRTWNLVKGRVAYKTNLKSCGHLRGPLDCLAMSPNGDYFSISDQRSVEIWSIKTADVLHKIDTKTKPISASWIGETDCLIGMENSTISWMQIDETTEKIDVKELITGHTGRVKAMDALNNYLVTASSLGDIKLWKLLREKRKIKEMSTTDIGCRPTCMNLLDCSTFPRNKEAFHENKLSLQRGMETVEKNKQTERRKLVRGFVVVEEESDAKLQTFVNGEKTLIKEKKMKDNTDALQGTSKRKNELKAKANLERKTKVQRINPQRRA